MSAAHTHTDDFNQLLDRTCILVPLLVLWISTI